MKTFLNIVSIVKFQSTATAESPAWDKATMYDEVQFSLEIDLYYKNMSDEDADALEIAKIENDNYMSDMYECMRG